MDRVYVLIQAELNSDFSQPIAFYTTVKEAEDALDYLLTLPHWRNLYSGYITKIENGKLISNCDLNCSTLWGWERREVDKCYSRLTDKIIAWKKE